MDFLELAVNRYSCRNFDQKEVELDKINLVLEAAKYAPTGCNNQEYEIYVLNTKKGREILKKITECHYNAPLSFVICKDKNKEWTRSFDNEKSGTIDASIVTTHMMLEAYNIGLGSTWIMYFDPKTVEKELNLPENIVPVSILVCGYPSKDSVPSENHYKRREIIEFSHFI